jgi:hypothetical protein
MLTWCRRNPLSQLGHDQRQDGTGPLFHGAHLADAQGHADYVLQQALHLALAQAAGAGE